MKGLPAENYLVESFRTHKTQTYGYTYLGGSNPSQVSVNLAVSTPMSVDAPFNPLTDGITANGLYQRPLYWSVRQKFYDENAVGRNFIPSSSILNVISIAQQAYGEGIQPGSFVLSGGSTIGRIVDDGIGGLVYSGPATSTIFSYSAGDNLVALNANVSGPAGRTFTDITGILKTASLNIARDSHYEGGARTVLVEPKSINLLQYSEQPNVAPWTPISLNFTPSASIAPDGTTTACKIILSGSVPSSSTAHYMYQSVNKVTGSAPYVASMFFKKAELTSLIFMVTNENTSAYTRMGVDLNAGTSSVISAAGGFSTIGSGVIPYGNGWYRVWLAGMCNTGSTAITIQFWPGSFVLTNAIVGDGVSGLYGWGAQLEQSSFYTSYIPTAITAVTRSADVLSFPLGETVSNITISSTPSSSVAVPSASLAIATGSIVTAVPTNVGIQNITVQRPVNTQRLGNIFYESGIAIINGSENQYQFSDIGLKLTTGSLLNISFQASHTIYQHTIMCTVDIGEFNYSINPSMAATQSVYGTTPIKVMDAFASGTLTPYMTSVGLYSDRGELVAVAKFPRPIKRATDSQQTIIIKFDV